MTPALDQRVATVRAIFARLSAGDPEIGDLLTDDIEFELPYAGDAFTSPICGRDAVVKSFRWVLGTLFHPLQLEIVAEHPGADANVLVVEYRSTGAVRSSGAPYANQYVGIFRLGDGRVAGWREYYDTEALKRALDPSA